MDNLKSEFVSTVSHELRTPVTSISGSLGLMLGGVVGETPAKAKELIDIAYKNTHHLLTLINDILDIEKIQSGKMEFDNQAAGIDAANRTGYQYKRRICRTIPGEFQIVEK